MSQGVGALGGGLSRRGKRPWSRWRLSPSDVVSQASQEGFGVSASRLDIHSRHGEHAEKELATVGDGPRSICYQCVGLARQEVPRCLQ